MDNITSNLAEFDFKSDDEPWDECCEMEFRIKFSNISDATSSKVFSLLKKHPKIHSVEQKEIKSISIDSDRPDSGIITVKSEVAFATILHANKKMFKKKELKFKSLEDPDVTDRITQSVIIPEIGSGMAPFIDEDAANESVLTEKRRSASTHKKKPLSPKRRPSTRTKPSQWHNRNPPRSPRSPHNAPLQRTRIQSHERPRNANTKEQYFRGGSANTQRSKTRNPVKSNRSPLDRTKTFSHAMARKEHRDRPTIKLNFSELNINAPEDIERPSIFGKGKPRQEKIAVAVETAKAVREPQNKSRYPPGLSEWTPKKDMKKNKSAKASTNRFKNLQVD